MMANAPRPPHIASTVAHSHTGTANNNLQFYIVFIHLILNKIIS